MKYLFFSITLLFASFVTYGHASEDYQNLLDSTSRYVEFINRFGSDEGESREESKSIFAPLFPKLINGELFIETPESFLEKMIEAKNAVGGWHAQILHLSVSSENRSVTLYYLFKTKEEKTYIAFTLLHFNEDQQITGLVTVYNPYAVQTDLVHIN